MCRVTLAYSSNCLDQESEKGPFGLRVKLPFAHLSTTNIGGMTLFLLILNAKQRSCEYQFYGLWFNLCGIQTQVYRFRSRHPIHSTTDLFKRGCGFALIEKLTFGLFFCCFFKFKTYSITRRTQSRDWESRSRLVKLNHLIDG